MKISGRSRSGGSTWSSYNSPSMMPWRGIIVRTTGPLPSLASVRNLGVALIAASMCSSVLNGRSKSKHLRGFGMSRAAYEPEEHRAGRYGFPVGLLEARVLGRMAERPVKTMHTMATARLAWPSHGPHPSIIENTPLLAISWHVKALQTATRVANESEMEFSFCHKSLHSQDARPQRARNSFLWWNRNQLNIERLIVLHD